MMALKKSVNTRAQTRPGSRIYGSPTRVLEVFIKSTVFKSAKYSLYIVNPLKSMIGRVF